MVKIMKLVISGARSTRKGTEGEIRIYTIHTPSSHHFPSFLMASLEGENVTYSALMNICAYLQALWPYRDSYLITFLALHLSLLLHPFELYIGCVHWEV
jgi:hypothetical protein